MKSRSRFKSLRDYVNAQPRTKSQGDIARELGVSESALSLYINGLRYPSRVMAIHLSKRTGVPVTAILGLDSQVA